MSDEHTPSVDVQLDGGRTRYRAGEIARGQVVVEAPRPRPCDAVVVRVWWAAWGTQDKTDHVEVAEEQSLARYAELSGRQVYDFALPVPAHIVTHEGRNVSISCVITARVRWPGDEEDTAARVDLTVVPAALPSGEGQAQSGPLATLRSAEDLRRRLGDDPTTAANAARFLRGARRQGWRKRLSSLGGWLAAALIGVGVLGFMVGGLVVGFAWILDAPSVGRIVDPGQSECCAISDPG